MGQDDRLEIQIRVDIEDLSPKLSGCASRVNAQAAFLMS